MTFLVAVSLLLVAAGGTAVVLTREPRAQAVVLSMYGLLLTVMFVVLQAPDVALSEIVVATVGLPLIILAALRKINEQEREREEDEKR